MTSQRKTAERIHIGRRKFQRAQRPKIERSHGSLPPLGIGESKLNGNTHIGRAQMSQNRPIGKLHHRMDGTLGLHYHLDLIVGHREQVVRLDDFEPLIHQRRGIDGDLRPHVPGGMGQCLSWRDRLQVGDRLASERAARSRHPQLRDLARILSEQTLVDGPVLRIDGHERPGRPCRRSYAGGPTIRIHRCCQRHNEVATHHKRLLVGQSEHLARLQRRIARLQASCPYQGVHDDIHLGQLGESHDGFEAHAEARLRVLLALGNGQRPHEARASSQRGSFAKAAFPTARWRTPNSRA